MRKMIDINKLSKQAHVNAVSKGFYVCPTCGGEATACTRCDGTGIDNDRSLRELLMLIISELGEAMEAHRKKNSVRVLERDIELLSLDDLWEQSPSCMMTLFQLRVKDTFEDEIADVFIRLFDFCGYYKIECDDNLVAETVRSLLDRADKEKYSVPEYFFEVTACIINYYDYMAFDSVAFDSVHKGQISGIFAMLLAFCADMNIDIETHIRLKMKYNSLREYKHGKAY